MMLNGEPVVAIVQQVEETERQLVERAQAAVSASAWEVGQCAFLWTQRHAKGRTDADFADQIGISRDQVTQRRLVYEAFADVCDTYHKLSWSHFYSALSWGDSAECLAWADENAASVAEMKAYRRMLHGDDLTQAESPEAGHTEDGGEPERRREAPALDSTPKGGDDDEGSESHVATDRRQAGGRVQSGGIGSTVERSGDTSGDSGSGRADTDLGGTTGGGDRTGDRGVSPSGDRADSGGNAAGQQLTGLSAAIDAIDRLCASLGVLGQQDRKKVATRMRRQADILDPPKTKARPSSVDEVAEYVRAANLPDVDAQAFWDHFESNGWKVGGRGPMKDWKAAVRNWSRNGKKFNERGATTHNATQLASNVEAVAGFLREG